MGKLSMSSESNTKSKKALTTLVGLFLVCLISECAVDGKSIRKTTTTDEVIPTKDSGKLPPSSLISNDDSLSVNDLTSTKKIMEANSGQDQIGGSIHVGYQIEAENEIIKITRSKRSPYPPGFVAWTWKEPCFCPPGQFFSCRCYYSSASSEENKFRKRRSRSGRKLKHKS